MRDVCKRRPRRKSLGLIRSLIALFAALATWSAERPWTEEYPVEAAAANKACSAKDYAQCLPHLTRLLVLLDGRADIVYRLAEAENALGHRESALKWLSLYSKSGLTFADPAAIKGLGDVREIEARFHTAQLPVSASTTWVALPEKDLLAEDIAYDHATERFFVSSVRHGKIVVIGKNGQVSDFVPERPDSWAVLALGVDVKRRILWASAVAMPERLGYAKADEGKSALLKYSLDSGAFLKRYDLGTDTKHALGDMALNQAGDVFVSDGFGQVYRVNHARDTLDILVDKGVFRSPQTPAPGPDGRRLFIPDYSRGISVLDLATKKVELLAHPPELSLGGIDGLYLRGRTMIAIQNGTVPERVIRLQLDAGLTRILSWETLECNWQGLGDPTHGVVLGKQFYFIANSGWDRMGDDGAMKPGEPPLIRRMLLRGQAQVQR